MAIMRAFIFFLARLLISSIFLIAGIGHLLDWESAEQAVTNSLYSMAEHSVHVSWLNELIEKLIPLAPFMLMSAIGLLILGSVLVILGIKVRLGAFFLILFLLPVTFIMHHFWLLQGPERLTEMTQFMKNIALVGGLLMLVVHPKEKPGASFNNGD